MKRDETRGEEKKNTIAWNQMQPNIYCYPKTICLVMSTNICPLRKTTTIQTGTELSGCETLNDKVCTSSIWTHRLINFRSTKESSATQKITARKRWKMYSNHVIKHFQNGWNLTRKGEMFAWRYYRTLQLPQGNIVHHAPAEQIVHHTSPGQYRTPHYPRAVSYTTFPQGSIVHHSFVHCWHFVSWCDLMWFNVILCHLTSQQDRERI